MSMRFNFLMKYQITRLLLPLLLLWSGSLFAATGFGTLSLEGRGGEFTQAPGRTAGLQFLVENEGQADQDTPAPGTLVLPAATDDDSKKDKKCMTVCARWGEECQYINRGAGGTSQKCRRACKQFTEECF